MLLHVEYFRHKIPAKGLQPTYEKIQTVRCAPALKDMSQLKSFLGLVKYYGKFLLPLNAKLMHANKFATMDD